MLIHTSVGMLFPPISVVTTAFFTDLIDAHNSPFMGTRDGHNPPVVLSPLRSVAHRQPVIYYRHFSPFSTISAPHFLQVISFDG
jgi:hypothetical protein